MPIKKHRNNTKNAFRLVFDNKHCLLIIVFLSIMIQRNMKLIKLKIDHYILMTTQKEKATILIVILTFNLISIQHNSLIIRR